LPLAKAKSDAHSAEAASGAQWKSMQGAAMNQLSQYFIAVVLVMFAANIGLAQNKPPLFKDYPVSETFTGKNAPLVLKREDTSFRTRLREAAKEKPNFAGHYIVAAWGCGAECLMGAAIDAKTGRVIWFPHTICCWGASVDQKFEPIEYRLNSSLIVFSGLRNEKEGDNGAHFYKLENGKFVHVRSILKTNQE
jgi:hypothetical protein